ncbi:hydrogenase expression protein HypA [Photobacterium sp. MCCC 1A19761]|uniref:hydrogenase expression protein HypA n=1 Tax=Photobacterium sp. MCCC 1A19761 TaxID=3115000 RepID=UPI00307EFDDE
MRAYLGCCLVAACSLFLTACGGGGGDNQPAAEGDAVPVSTKFTITVDTPPDLITASRSGGFGLIRTAYADAQTNLAQANFAAVWLDKKGKILEQIEITDVKNQGDGIYDITLGSRTRINAVLLIDLSNSPDIAIAPGEPIPDHVYMAPLTEERLTVSLKSTLAYHALVERVIQDESWGIFEGLYDEPIRSRVFFFQEDLDRIADDLETTLLPQVGLQGMKLSDLLSLSIVKTMTQGRMERFVTEQAAAQANIQAILNDGYWTVGTFNDNSGSGILTEQMVYNADNTSVGETAIHEFRWDKNGAADIALTEVFTYLSGSTEFTNNDITRQVLTAQGWVGLFDYLKVELATDKTMLLTDAALTREDKAGITMDAKVYQLAGKKMHDFLSSEDNYHITRYIKPDETFSEGAFGFYFTWRPESETYLLCDNRNGNTDCQVAPFGLPNSPYTELNGVLTAPADAAISIDGINGFAIADNVVVELLNDNSFTARYWVNIAANTWNIQENGFWAPTTVAGKSIIRFDVPNVIQQLADHYRFSHENLFLVEDRNFVHIGETLLENQPFHYSGFDNNAKQQIFASASRDNLPPFGVCDFGNGLGANPDLYLNTVTECGGDERFTQQTLNNLMDQHLVQITEDGEISTTILRSNNSWEYYVHGLRQGGSRSWSLTEQGYLKLTPNTATPDEFEYWALTSVDYSRKLLAVKAYGAQPEADLIFTLISKEYSPGQLAACATQDSGWDSATTTPVTKKTLTQYQDQTALCKQIWEQRNPRFTQALLIGQSGDTSDDRALRFIGDSSRFLKLSDNFQGDFFLGNYVDSDGCGFNFPIRWKLEEDGTLYYEAVDGSMNERIAMTDTDGLGFAIKAFNHQARWQNDPDLQYAATDGEMWSDLVTLVDAGTVPNVVPITEPVNPPAEPPADGEPQGPVAGTVLNDGQTCGFTQSQ